MKTFNGTMIAASVFLLFATGAIPALAGPMKGANGHVASGNATVSGGNVELGPDFKFDGGPDVYVAVRRDGKIQLLEKLRANEGAQTYSLPSGAEADEILLFCKKYNVTLGKAAVN